MPAYNAEATIWAAVDSVFNQTFADLELIVCDDASVDGTPDILASISDDRLRVLRNETNQGEGRSRDAAIAASRAPWVAVIDADDCWLPERLEKLLLLAEQGCGYMVFDNIMTCHDVDGRLVPWRPVRGSNAFGYAGEAGAEVSLERYIREDRLLIKPLMPARFIRENSIRHTDRKFGADTEFFLRLASHGVKLKYIPEPLYWYRISPASVTAKTADARLMRYCIQECANMALWSQAIQAAFADKIALLAANEVLYEARSLLLGGRPLSALRIIFANPRALEILPRRLWRHLGYQIHRLATGGVAGR